MTRARRRHTFRIVTVPLRVNNERIEVLIAPGDQPRCNAGAGLGALSDARIAMVSDGRAGDDPAGRYGGV